jgi:hypothetical protein
MRGLWRGASIAVMAMLSATCGGDQRPGPTQPFPPTLNAGAGGGTYTTSFPLTENPISEAGNWINGGTTGVDWTNVSTTPGLAIGRQTSGSYNDATAILTGSWGPNQRVTGTVYSVNQRDVCDQEVELRLRSAISAHFNRGYEISYKVSQTSAAYLIIVRWNGALGNFTILFSKSGSQYGIKTGDVVSAGVTGNVITVYKNGVQMGQVTDGTFSAGAPGMGFSQDNGPSGCSSANGTYGYTSFTATDGTSGSPLPATKLSVAVQPATATAGAAIAPAVQVAVQDSLGNLVTSSTASVTVALTSGTGTAGARLRGTATVNSVNGVATFPTLSVDSVGSGYTLTATSTGLTGTTSAAFAVVPAPAVRLGFAVQPASAVAGAAIAPAVKVMVQDSLGNVVTSSSASVTVALGSGTGTAGARLRGTTTVSAVGGVATFSALSVDSVGIGYRLAASATGLTGATSGTFSVAPAPAVRLGFSVQPASSSAGAVIVPAVKVAVQDSLGNVVTSSTASVTVALGSGTGTAGARLRGTTTVNAVGGVATFATLSVDSVGIGYRLAASAAGLNGATSGTFNVASAPSARLSFAVQPANSSAGAAISPAVKVAVQDSLGNVVTSSTVNITVALSSGTGTAGARLGGTTTVNAVNGVATFSTLTVDSTGAGYALTASATGLSGATSSAFSVATSSATRLAFAAQPGNATAGTSVTPAVQVAVQDAQGNVVTSSTASVTVALSGGTGTAGAHLRGPVTVNAVSGVATFATLSVDSVGSGYTLSAISTGLSGATSAAFAVVPAPPVRLGFAVQPANTVTGAAITPAVKVMVQDSLGNVVTSSTASVTVALGSGSGTAGAHLRGTVTVAAVNGVATFSTLSVDSVGSGYTLAATAVGLLGATSTALTVVAAPPARLGFAVPPANAVAGAAITPAVKVVVQDSLGNVVTSSTASLTLALSGGAGTAGARLRGTTTVSAVSGVATFATLSVDSAGTGYRLAATAAGLTGATSGAFNVAPAPATRLSFIVQPASAVAGAVIVPAVKVAVRDSLGNVVTSATASVTLAISNGTGTAGARLGGATIVSAVGGVATFGTLTVDLAGTGYTLTGSAAGLVSATSAAFTVTPAGGRTYTTSFPLTENPISEASNWINGGTTGLDWTNVSTTPGLAIGRQTSGAYNDATAILTGIWGANQSVAGSVYSVNQRDVCDQQVELRLRSAISAHVNRGYEISYKVSQTSAAYLIIVRWNGAIGNFTILFNKSGSQYGIKTGDVVSAGITGTVITVYKNGAQMGQVTDGTFSAGAPGVGFSQDNGPSGCAGTNGNYGYTTVAATDAGSITLPPPATKLGFAVQPTSTTTGAAITPAVQVAVQDSLGNVVTSSTASVTVALASGTGTAGARLGGTTTVSAINGVATFPTLSVDSLGSGYRLTVSASGLTGATSSPFAVSAAGARKLAFAVQPASTTAGAVITPAVQVAVQDSLGNLVTSSAASVTLAISSGTGTAGARLGGTTTVSAVNGVATFPTLSVDSAGSGYSLTASAAGLSGATSAAFAVSPLSGRTYTTSFPLTENPISEAGSWVNGGTVGLDWSDVSTTPGLAIGNQVGANYTDATAVLTGAWGPNQQATATVFSVNPNDACGQEVELRLRSTVSAHVNRGYEISYKVSQTSAAYLLIVRWNGALSDFTYLFNQSGAPYGVTNGDVVSATVIGNVITVYKNGWQMAQVADNAFTAGAPGMGFNLDNAPAGCAGTNGNYGYTSFAATDAVAP